MSHFGTLVKQLRQESGLSHLAVQEAAKIGASGFLSKPFSLDTLRLMLASRLRV